MHDDLITLEEAAELLEVGVRRVQEMVSSGMLSAHTGPRKGRGRRPLLVKMEDVSILRHLRSQKIDMVTAASMAMHAMLNTKRMERAVKHLLVATKLDIPFIDLDKEAIVSLHLRVKDALAVKATVAEVYEWARLFHAVGEETLEAIELHTGDREPWQCFIKLGKKLMKEMPRALVLEPPETRAVYQLLSHGIRNTRMACISYVQLKHGRKTAFELFPDAEGNAINELTSLSSVIFK